MAKVKILVNFSFADDSSVQKVKSAFDGVEIHRADTEEEALELMPGINIFWCGSFTPRMFKAAPNLRWVHAGSAGVNHMLFPEFIESDIVLTASKGTHAIQMAEHIFALILAFTRKLPMAWEAQKRSEWLHEDVSRGGIAEVYERTMGIIGLGGVGLEVAKRAKGFGMKVVAFKRRPSPKPDYVDELYLEDRLKDVLAESDFVVVTLPLTPSTEGMIGEKELKAMKPGAYLVNIGRGKTIDEETLAKALEEGWIGGAGLDVFAEEPLPPTSPLWRLPNIIITPHTSGGSPHVGGRSTELFCENLRRFLAGEELINVVDKREGY